MESFLKFANKKAMANNPIQGLLYFIAYPVAIIAKNIGLSPNGVTLISFIFTIFAFIALVLKNLFIFVILWFIAYILDYSDGTLARMTNSKGKTALNVDHISDLVKISLILLGFAIYYNDQIIWVLTYIASSLYLFFTVLNHELVWNKIFYLIKNLNEKNKVKNRNSVNKINQSTTQNLKKFINKRPLLKQFIISLFNIFLTINGHTLIIFFLIPVKFNYAVIFLIYFILLTMFQVIQKIKYLNNLKKIDV